MKSFNRILALVIAVIALIFIMADTLILTLSGSGGRPYRVEIGRLAREIEKSGFENISLDNCEYVTAVTCYNGTDYKTFDEDAGSGYAAFFEETDSDYSVRIINGVAYRFDYTVGPRVNNRRIILAVNLILAVMSLLTISVMLFIRSKIIKPFEALRDVPFELSKGNLTVPIKENRYRFFGKFVWGINILRENLEQHKQRELALLKEKKTLVLSLSHDIKTPLSAIKLYSKALSKGLYGDEEKQLEIAESINAKADEIEKYVSEIITASSGDFLELDVENGEFYLSALTDEILHYYKDKLALMKIGFSVGKYSDCLLKGDLDRSVEVLQNIIENAVKYGDGGRIELEFADEEDCKLITVKNSGASLSEEELPRIFESFARGSNAAGISGSGLGLYICRQLMHKMGGEAFAQIEDGNMLVTAVFVRAE